MLATDGTARLKDCMETATEERISALEGVLWGPRAEEDIAVASLMKSRPESAKKAPRRTCRCSDREVTVVDKLGSTPYRPVVRNVRKQLAGLVEDGARHTCGRLSDGVAKR